MEKYDQAISDFTRAINLKPESFETYQERGEIYRRMEQYDLALNDYTKAIQLGSKNFDVYQNRGKLHLYLKQDEEAIADFSQAIQIDPTRAESFLLRGFSHSRLAHYDLAIQDFLQVTEMTEEYSADCYLRIALCYDFLQDSKQALKYYQLFLSTPGSEKMSEEANLAEIRIKELI